MERMETIGAVLVKNPDKAFTITELADKTQLHPLTVKRYIELFSYMQAIPYGIQVINGGRITMVQLKMDYKKENEEIKGMFPEIGDDNKILITLLTTDATRKENAIKLDENETVKKLVKLERIEKVDGRYHLTHIGKMIAKGIKEIYK